MKLPDLGGYLDYINIDTISAIESGWTHDDLSSLGMESLLL